MKPMVSFKPILERLLGGLRVKILFAKFLPLFAPSLQKNPNIT